MERRYRPRKEFKFWLYHDLTEQVKLMEYIDYLRKTRQFASKIRDGLKLIWTLSEGDTSFLQELFPGIVASLKNNSPAPPETPPGLLEQFRQITRDEVESALLKLPAQTGIPNGILQKSAVPALTSGGMNTMSGFDSIQAPDFDEEEDIVIIKRDPNAGNDFMANLLKSADAMANMPITEDTVKVAAVREFKKSELHH